MHQGKKDDSPPFLKSWNAIYLLLIAVLAVVIGAFYLFTKHFE